MFSLKNAHFEYVSNLWCIFRKISVNLNKFQFLTYVTNFFWGKIFSCESCEYLARWITTSIFLLSGDTQSSGKPSVDFKISPKSPTWSPHASSTEESPMSQVDQFREDQSESITNLQNHDLMNTFFKLLLSDPYRGSDLETAFWLLFLFHLGKLGLSS